MRHDKEKIFSLRRTGKSYNEIKKMTGVSKSTLCDWLKNEEWSMHIKSNNINQHIKISTERLRKMHDANRIILEKRYKKAEEEAEKEFKQYRNDTLFTAGIMLYIGEGDKLNKCNIRIANTDFYVHKIFIKFLKRFLGAKIENIKFSILLYPDLDIEDCRKKWSEELNIPLSNFHKPVIIKGKLKNRRLRFGVGSIIMSSTYSKKKLARWIRLSEEFLSK